MVLFPEMTSGQWDVHAKEYAQMPFQGLLSIPAKLILERANDASPFANATSILDIGCGSGLVISMLATGYGKQIPAMAQITASDFSPEMVKCCREKRAEIMGTKDDVGDVWTRCEMRVLDAGTLKGVDEGTMSHVLGSLVYFMLPDPRKGVQEAYRVLRPGGAFSINSWHKIEWSDIMHQAAVRVRPDAPTGFDPLKLEAWSTTEGLKAELEEAGFKDVKTSYHASYMSMQNPVMFVNGFVRSSNPGAKMIFGNFSEKEMDRACEEFLKLVEGRKELEGVFLVATGTK